MNEERLAAKLKNEKITAVNADGTVISVGRGRYRASEAARRVFSTVTSPRRLLLLDGEGTVLEAMSDDEDRGQPVESASEIYSRAIRDVRGVYAEAYATANKATEVALARMETALEMSNQAQNLFLRASIAKERTRAERLQMQSEEGPEQGNDLVRMVQGAVPQLLPHLLPHLKVLLPDLVK
jgi:hypothetical protein